MHRRLRTWTAIASAVAMGALTTGFAPATTAPNDMPEARAFLAEYGADESTQDRLVSTYLAGGRWDSMKGVEPVSTQESTRADGTYTVSTFPDGSIQVTRVEHASPASIVSRGITGCSVNGKQYNGCKIDTWVGAVAMSFYTSYNLGTNTVTASPWGAGWSLWPDCGSSVTYLGKPTTNRAQLNLKATMCATLFTTNFELRLTVAGGKATVTWA
ncbi:hypothetical protein [Leifsonia sp. Le1]|uniref:hypothetical protein n=1 Tax=Leifsonia sp. Le1 TaxID=3404918 RepID=UPI003EBC54F0